MEGKCGKEWPRKFLVQNFPKTFINGPLKKVREKYLLDRELALLPATQSVVEAIIEKEEKQKELQELDKLIRSLERQRGTLVWGMNNVVAKKGQNFTRCCPAPECRGFLSTQWKCGLCNLWTCPDCHVLKGDEKNDGHVCNADDLATAKLLDNDTKSCPKCHTGIYRIEGCDQMWCTQCHTGFNWRTGNIETRLHNPHYFEYQRLHGGLERAPGDIVCGRNLDYVVYNRFLTVLNFPFKESNGKAMCDSLKKAVGNIIRSITHLREVQLVNYRVNEVENNEALRVKYMRNEIDKETFQSRIQRDNKRWEKKREINEVCQLLVTMTTDIMYRVIDVQSEKEYADLFKIMKTGVSSKTGYSKKLLHEYEEKTMKILMELEPLRAYINECLLEIAHTYGSKPKMIEYLMMDQIYGDVLKSVPSEPKPKKQHAKDVAGEHLLPSVIILA